MKKILPFVAGLLFVVLPASAQTWFAPDARWSYNLSGGLAGFFFDFNMTVGPDSVIAGKTCKNLLILNSPIAFPQSRFAYAEGNKVYLWQAEQHAFVKAYDFDLPVGSVVSVPIVYGGSTVDYQIESIDTLQIGSNDRKRQKVVRLSNGAPTSERFEIIESIGAVGLPDQPVCSYFFIDQMECASVVDGFDIKFLCYQSGAGSYIPYGSCILSEETPLAETPRLQISPNPASDFIQLKIINLRVPIAHTSILNAQGQRLQIRAGLPEQWELSCLPDGVYWLQVTLADGRQVGARFVKTT